MHAHPTRQLIHGLATVAVLAVAAPAITHASDVQLLLPLGRTAYQTNEAIDLAVVRRDAAALPAAELAITVTGEAGSKLQLVFPVTAVAVTGKDARATELLQLNGRLLRPGGYTVSATVHGATGEVKFDLFTHVRKSSFRIVDWGSRAGGAELVRLGEDSLGFNTVLGNFRLGQMANVEGAIRGGLDYMQVCTMSGAHQMDLRSECDWSDPYVLGGGAARGVQQAFISRTTPNCLGVHFYDEPGLTWEGDAGAMGVSAQHRSYHSAFGKSVPPFNAMKPDDPAFRQAWTEWHNWHESFMDAAWKHSGFGVPYVRPDFLPITQSVYGFTAYADGYYFNVVRSLPLISGHGGYSDGQTGFYYPAWHMEYGRMRDLNKPYWYLPSWYLMSSDQYRVEQYMSFQNNLQGMMKPPDHQVHKPESCQDSEGILEANKIQARLGTVFSTMPVTRPPVAVLFSMSQLLDGEMRGILADPKNYGAWAYEGGGHSRAASLMSYIASKALHIPFFPVVEEDILDGTLAQNHHVLVVPGVNALDTKTVSALTGFIQGGGTVLVSDESKVVIPGALKVGASLPLDAYNTIGSLWTKDNKQYWIQASAGHYRKELKGFITALGEKLKQAHIEPVFACDNPGIVASRQAQGDVEYLFAVNGCNDMAASMNTLVATAAVIGMPADGRPVYDAVRGGELTLKKDGALVSDAFRFGPGQMRVFARTVRPIGGVQCLPPVPFCDYTVATDPLRVTFGAVVVDSGKRVLSGSIPLEITITDPLGGVRYHLYRATAHGLLQLDLPLAANDPAGDWHVTIRELLSGCEDRTRFAFAPATSCGALAGGTTRALTFGNDRENIFRFFKLHKDVTIVTGTAPFHAAAAERLSSILAPWGVRCQTVAAADVNKPRQIPEAAQRSWVGLDFGRPDFKKGPALGQTGFAVDGPVLLLGTPADNPLVKFLLEKGFLPYKPVVDTLPGRGYLAWQTDAVGYFNQESVTLIADDQAGMAEAVGTLYEICAGIDPLMAKTPPAVATVAPASQAPAPVPGFTVTWRALLSDRVIGLQADGNRIAAVSRDGSLTTLSAKGSTEKTKVASVADAETKAKAMQPPANAELLKKLADPRFIAKFTLPLTHDLTAVAYWGGLLKTVAADGTVKQQQLLPLDITALAVAHGQLLVGLSDGQVLSLQPAAK